MTREERQNVLHSVAPGFLSEQGLIPNLYADQILRAVKYGAEWADEHPRKDLVEINKIYIWLYDFLDKHYIEDRSEAEEINANSVLKDFLKAVKGE